MAGHNKWSKVKRIKGVLDSRRGKLFSRFSKEITVAAKLGGADADFNPRLRTAILSARAQNMPNDNIERALKKATGEGGSATLEEIIYEGYAPGGVALIIEVATDNRNRTAADLRQILSKHHGNLATSGSVSYLFHRRGRILIPEGSAKEDALLEILLEAGGEDMTNEDGYFVILTPPDRLYAVVEALKEAQIEPETAELTFIAQNAISVNDPQTAAQVIHLHDTLEDYEDVMNVFSNFDPPEETTDDQAA